MINTEGKSARIKLINKKQLNKLAKREQVYYALITEQDIAKIKKEDRSEISKLDPIIWSLNEKYQDRFLKESPPELLSN